MLEKYGATIRLGIFIAGLVIFLLFELIKPYRPDTVPKWKRWLINLGMSAFNSVVLQVIFAGVIIRTSMYVTEHRIGALNHLDLPWWGNTLITLIFMDFMLYVWHLLNHEVPLLWRFHRVHHTDLNMDVSTATRFHLGELAVSAVIKASLVYLIGADLLGVLVFESALVLCAQFHHSSLRVPQGFEKWFWLLFVPPSMHRIHHSVKIRERDSNYGTVFSVWDRIMGTMVTGVEQSKIIIGVGGHHQESKLNIHHLLVMPFLPAVR